MKTNAALLTALALCALACQGSNLPEPQVAQSPALPRLPSPPAENATADEEKNDRKQTEQWLLNFAKNADPLGFCLETCEGLMVCEQVTTRYPDESGRTLRSQCETACKTDEALRDHLNTFGTSGTLGTSDCELSPEVEKAFHL
jgi:hypothetical protein